MAMLDYASLMGSTYQPKQSKSIWDTIAENLQKQTEQQGTLTSQFASPNAMQDTSTQTTQPGQNPDLQARRAYLLNQLRDRNRLPQRQNLMY